MVWSPQFRRVPVEGGGGDVYVVGHALVDDFLEFARGRARPNTVRAYAHDLKTFFAVVGKEPTEVRAADVMVFVKDQRHARRDMSNVVRISDGSAGLSSATIRRRLAAVSAFYGNLVARGDVGVDTNPVPRGLPTRRRRRDGRRPAERQARPGHQAGFATATDAARARRELLEQADGGGGAPRASLSMTVGQLLDEYFDGIDTDGRLSPKTRHDYRRNADAYVQPWPGEHRVRALTPGGDSGVATPAQRGDRHPAGTAACPRTRSASPGRHWPGRSAWRSSPASCAPTHWPQCSSPRRADPLRGTGCPSRPESSWRPRPGTGFTPLWAFLLGSGLRIGELVWLRWRRTIRAGESQAIPPSVVHSVDVPDGAVLSVDFLTRPWRHQEAPPGGATWR